MGHINRMVQMYIPARVLDSQPDGKRGIGISKLHWLDGVREDLNKLGIKNWSQRIDMVGDET